MSKKTRDDKAPDLSIRRRTFIKTMAAASQSSPRALVAVDLNSKNQAPTGP